MTWGVLGLLEASPSARISVVRLTTTVLHLVVGLLLVQRARLVGSGTPAAIASSAPSLLLAGVLMKIAPMPQDWPVLAQVLFASGAALAIYALVSLGKSFAIFPAARALVHRGPYRWVRHPAYAGELVMICACALAKGSVEALALLVLTACFIGLRISVEERTLRALLPYRGYRGYQETVRFRLVPGIW